MSRRGFPCRSLAIQFRAWSCQARKDPMDGGGQDQLLVVTPGPGVDPVGVAATLTMALARASAVRRPAASSSAATAAAPAAVGVAPATTARAAPAATAGAAPAAAAGAAPAAACKAGTRPGLLRRSTRG